MAYFLPTPLNITNTGYVSLLLFLAAVASSSIQLFLVLNGLSETLRPDGGKGKSGGSRVITCVKVEKENVFLLSIFDKSEQATISEKELKELLKLIPE